MFLFFVCLHLISLPGVCFGQSVVTRTANLESAVLSEKGVFYFDYTHRFIITGAPAYKVVNFPTFILAEGLFENTEIKARYATNSEIILGRPNELEFMVKYNLSRIFTLPDISIAVAPSYNLTANSLDGVIPVEFHITKDFQSTVNVVWLGNSAASEKFEILFGAGIIYYLGDKMSIALDAKQTFGSFVWSAGLNFVIPESPHTISLHVTDASTNTVQGSVFKASSLRYGFEFTIRH